MRIFAPTLSLKTHPKMSHLCIDIGNTRTKLATFAADDSMIDLQFVPHIETIEAVDKILVAQQISHCILSSVATRDAALIAFLSQNTHFIELSHRTHIPIDNRYKTPETLGKDRLAAVIAANYLYPNEAVLVIDAGSCITFDFIDGHACYWGGSITPGIKMRFKAMHHFTGRLPLMALPENIPSLTENTTATAMQSGIYWGVLAEVEGIIKAYQKDFPHLQIIVTGGDTDFLKQHLSIDVQADPYLVLQGLHRILQYNIELDETHA
mgnify:CR=1 FL=1